MSFKFDKIRIDPVELAIAGNGILGIKDSGKSYTATLLAEHIHDGGIPFTAFDPTGIWKFLRVPGHGKGRPIIVVGLGPDADLRLSGATISKVIEAAMQSGVSLVIDLSHPDLSKADWRKIVRDGVKTLLHKNEPFGLRHVFLEEAAEFVPQKISDGLVYAEVEKLARIGGNARLGYTLINQRAEEVNKAVLELCDNLFLHRQKGKNSLLSLRKWMDVADVEDGQLIVNTLSKLPTGQCWAWMRESDRPVLCKVPQKDSFHPNRRDLRGSEAVVKAKAVDVASFVTKLQSQLPAIEEHEKANDPALLRKRIAELEREKKGAQGVLAIDPAASAKEYMRGRDEGYRAGMEAATAAWGQSIVRIQKAQESVVAFVQGEAQGSVKFQAPDTRHSKGRSPPPAAPPTHRPAPSPPRRAAEANGSLPRGEKACLICMAQQDDGATREQLTVVTGYKRSSRDAYVQRLRDKGYAYLDGDRVLATANGIAALGSDYEPLPMGSALRDFHLRRLPEGERRVLEMLIEAYPNAVQRDAIDEVTQYKRSSRDAYLQRLSARQLVLNAGAGQVKASDKLF